MPPETTTRSQAEDRRPDKRPVPTPTTLSRPHWDGCKEGVLRVQRCADCGTCVFIPQPICTECQSERLEWTESSGRGTVYSYTIVHRPPRPEFDVPYVVAIVELEEGWFMLTNVVGCEPGEVSVGMAVRVEFEERAGGISVPVFGRA